MNGKQANGGYTGEYKGQYTGEYSVSNGVMPYGVMPAAGMGGYAIGTYNGTLQIGVMPL